jgi:hypothetical protein
VRSVRGAAVEPEIMSKQRAKCDDDSSEGHCVLGGIKPGLSGCPFPGEVFGGSGH